MENVYKTIVNPVTNRKVKVHSKAGKKVLKSYLARVSRKKSQKGGMIRAISRLPMEQLNRTDNTLVCRTTTI